MDTQSMNTALRPPLVNTEKMVQARVAAGLSQRELAERLSMNTQTIVAIENRYRLPSLETLAAIASAVNIKTSELVADEAQHVS